jgi:hypothetical protein
MADTAPNVGETPALDEVDHGLNQRIFRAMVAATVIAVGVSALVAPWRVTTGLLLGGLLALFSHRWLKNSAAAAINLSIGVGRKQLGVVQFVLRYVVIGSIVFAAYQLNVVSLPAVLFGLATFVVALFVEALREFYFAFSARGN